MIFAMIIGILQMEILLPEARSLKDKRSKLNNMKNRVRKQFNAAIAELRHFNEFSRTVLGVVTINNERKIVDQLLGQIERFIEFQFGIIVVNRKVEII